MHEDREPSKEAPSAGMPGLYQPQAIKPDAAAARTFALEVDGEQFDVCLTVDAATGYTDTSYTWLSGPHPGYGFGVGGPPNPTLEEHRQRIRGFLAMVDPATGLIADV